MFIALDRLLTIKYRSWSLKHFNGQRVICFIFFLFFILFGLNAVILVKVGYIAVQNATETVVCLATAYNDYSIFDVVAVVREKF